MKSAVVVGKESATGVTGGTTSFFFSDRDGNNLGSVEFYNGLLVGDDGMYQVAR